MISVFFLTSSLSLQLQVTNSVHVLSQRGRHAFPAIGIETPLEFLMSTILFLPSLPKRKRSGITPPKICRHTDVAAPSSVKFSRPVSRGREFCSRAVALELSYTLHPCSRQMTGEPASDLSKVETHPMGFSDVFAGG
ncbi:hypothetical protein BJY00DRAFT_4250 [Aspergillus carlsbadensis]|nr:hypothetical protein BJY00DRAFT_4250 [Aspergillus carlsbadensis]